MAHTYYRLHLIIAIFCLALAVFPAARGGFTLAQLPGLPAPQQEAVEIAVDDESDTHEARQIQLDVLLDNRPQDWLILLITIFLGVLTGRILSSLLRRAGTRLEDGRLSVGGQLLNAAASPISLAIVAIALRVGIMRLQMGPALGAFWPDVVTFLLYISIIWFLFNAVDLVEIGMRRYISARHPSELAMMMIPMVRKSLRICVIVWGIMLIADNVFDQDIGAWLAGVGIAGLAVSLAAQDSLKNLFGSVTILLDKPFKVGDRIVYKGYDGPVEDIGFRSTKVRTLSGNLVTIPNSNIVNDPVENISARPSIQRVMNITITYDTPADKIRQAVEILRAVCEEEGIAEPIHGKIGNDEFPPRVYFNSFNSDSLNILVIYWFFPPAYWDFLDHAQRLNLRIFEAFEEAGIDFAFPTQTLFLAGDEKRRLAVELLGQEFPPRDLSAPPAPSQ